MYYLLLVLCALWGRGFTIVFFLFLFKWAHEDKFQSRCNSFKVLLCYKSVKTPHNSFNSMLRSCTWYFVHNTYLQCVLCPSLMMTFELSEAAAAQIFFNLLFVWRQTGMWLRRGRCRSSPGPCWSLLGWATYSYSYTAKVKQRNFFSLAACHWWNEGFCWLITCHIGW